MPPKAKAMPATRSSRVSVPKVTDPVESPVQSKPAKRTPIADSSQKQDEPRPAKRQRMSGEQDVLHDLYKTPVTIEVGPDLYPFHTYKELLCHDSTHFEAAFEDNFLKRKKDTIVLPEDDVETFKIYQTYLNTMQLRYNFDGEEWWLRFAKLWIFADKIGSPSLKRRTVDAIIDTLKKNPELECASPEAVTYTYDKISRHCTLKRILAWHFIQKAGSNTSVDKLVQYPHAFVSRLAARLLEHAASCQKYTNALASSSARFHEGCAEEYCRKRRSSAGQTPTNSVAER